MNDEPTNTIVLNINTSMSQQLIEFATVATSLFVSKCKPSTVKMERILKYSTQHLNTSSQQSSGS